MADGRKDKTAWNGGIKVVGAAGKDEDKPISERIEGLNIAIRRDKRMLRDPKRAQKP